MTSCRNFLFSETLVSDKFKELVTLLHSVRLFDTLMAFPLKQFVEKQVRPVLKNNYYYDRDRIREASFVSMC